MKVVEIMHLSELRWYDTSKPTVKKYKLTGYFVDDENTEKVLDTVAISLDAAFKKFAQQTKGHKFKIVAIDIADDTKSNNYQPFGIDKLFKVPAGFVI